MHATTTTTETIIGAMEEVLPTPPLVEGTAVRGSYLGHTFTGVLDHEPREREGTPGTWQFFVALDEPITVNTACGPTDRVCCWAQADGSCIEAHGDEADYVVAQPIVRRLVNVQASNLKPGDAIINLGTVRLADHDGDDTVYVRFDDDTAANFPAGRMLAVYRTEAVQVFTLREV